MNNEANASVGPTPRSRQCVQQLRPIHAVSRVNTSMETALTVAALLGGSLSHSPVVTLNLQIASHHPRDLAKKSLPEFSNSPKAM